MTRLRQVLWWLIAGALLCAAIPWLFLRTTLYAYVDWKAPVVAAIALGVCAGTALLLTATEIVRRRFSLPSGVIKGVTVAVVAYLFYGLGYVSMASVKTPALRDQYFALHPALRLAVGTFFVWDTDGLLTAGKRAREDYTAMGLRPLRQSLHYPQASGYVHAIDLRTRGRSPRANLWMEGYFRSLGLNTLRHVGTADHLHVSLPVAENPALAQAK